MLKKLYANNYRCLVNFEIDLDPLTLLVGPNGGGKSTLFDLLYGIRQLIVENARIGDIFPTECLTKWVTQTEQTFELEVQGEDGLFSYKLVLSHLPEVKRQRIDLEQLLHDGRPLFEFKLGEVHLYHDDHQPGPTYAFDWTGSALSTIGPRPDNKKLTWFKKWVAALFVLSLQPRAMTSQTDTESDWLNRDGTNFASWYRYISQEHQDRVFELTKQLRDTIPGFHAFKLEAVGNSRICLSVCLRTLI